MAPVFPHHKYQEWKIRTRANLTSSRYQRKDSSLTEELKNINNCQMSVHSFTRLSSKYKCIWREWVGVIAHNEINPPPLLFRRHGFTRTAKTYEVLTFQLEKRHTQFEGCPDIYCCVSCMSYYVVLLQHSLRLLCIIRYFILLWIKTQD